MQEKIFEILFDKDEITWQTIILNLIKTEEMNPWDIDISLLAKKYIEMLKKLKDMDFRISGKVVLAAAILLRIKSNRLVGEDINELDRLMASKDIDELQDEFYDELESQLDFGGDPNLRPERPSLSPRTPQPRERKVSVYDLMDALQKALDVQKRRVMRTIPEPKPYVPKKTVEITSIIKEVYGKINAFFFENKSQQRLTFTQLIPSDSKEDKVLTFIPVLHLTNDRKIDVMQEQHFGEIEILLNKARSGREVEKELSGRKDVKIMASDYFVFCNGTKARNINELAEHIQSIDRKTFRHHVSRKKNDFAAWVGDVLGDKELASSLRSTTGFQETKNIIIESVL